MANKRWGLGMLAMALAFGLAAMGCASKPAVSEDGLFEYKISGIGVKNVYITQYLGTETDVVIPEQIDGNPVYWIGAVGMAAMKSNKDDFVGAFEGKSITSVDFPDSLRTINTRAFANNNLASVTLPDDIFIGRSAFAGNPITEFTLEGVRSNSSDSLLTLTPYYYGNGKQPGVYTLNDDGVWEYDGSECDVLPAVIRIDGSIPLLALNGKSKNSLEDEYAEFRVGVEHWVPAGTHTLRIGKSSDKTITVYTLADSWEIQGNFEAGISYLVKEKEDKTGVEIIEQGPWSPSQGDGREANSGRQR